MSNYFCGKEKYELNRIEEYRGEIYYKSEGDEVSRKIYEKLPDLYDLPKPKRKRHIIKRYKRSRFR